MIKTTNRDFGKLTELLRKANVSFIGINEQTEMAAPATVVAAAIMPFLYTDTVVGADLLKQRGTLLEQFGINSPGETHESVAQRIIDSTDPITLSRIETLRGEWDRWDTFREKSEPELPLIDNSSRARLGKSIDTGLRIAAIEQSMGYLTAVVQKPTI